MPLNNLGAAYVYNYNAKNEVFEFINYTYTDLIYNFLSDVLECME